MPKPTLSSFRALTLWPCLLLPLGGAALIAACVGNAAPAQPTAMTPVALLGEKIFNDPTLSASGAQSCASCHQPAHAGADADVVPLGGPTMTTTGFRNAPSVRYLDRTPPFHFEADGTPVGGFNRDGRAQTLAEQARRPFTAPHEMANTDAAALVARLRGAAYVDEFRAVFGANALDDANAAFTRVVAAVAQYERENPAFHPYNSRYDAFLAGQPTLNAQELRGLKLFNDPQKGNCAACHPSQRGDDGAPPLFTDFSYDNLGVPRNSAIPATADPTYYDLGLCGPDRTDLAARKDLCGAFKVPTLRNVAVTAPYFHNGRFASLRDVVAFYVRRDTHPAEWYPLNGDGVPEKFNDLPPAYRANVNVSEVPYDRKPGQLPALSDSEIDDVVAFLQTLTDADLASPP